MPELFLKDDLTRRWFNYCSALSTLLYGQNGFFYPRFEMLLTLFSGRPDTVSWYDIDPLRQTLEQLINFDILNAGEVRYTIGAVEISQGKPVYFDNTKQKIGVEHILASGTLPPGFPAIEIDGRYYWDGGILSNSPTEVLINEQQHKNTLCFMANLFDSYGLHPQSLDDVLKRYKDIIYSSRYRSQIQDFRKELKLLNTIHFLYDKLPDNLKNDPVIKEIYLSFGKKMETMHFVRFLYTAPATELSSKDFEFSKLSIEERFESGYQDGLTAVNESPWKSVTEEKVEIHEICTHPTVLQMVDAEKRSNQKVNLDVMEEIT